MNSKAGTPHSHTRSQPRGITTTPSKPRVRNPYQKSLDENQSSQPIAAARTPRSVTRLTSTSTPLTTALINPYAKSTSYASRAVSKIDPSCDSLKRNLGFADEDTGPQPSKKIPPTRSSRNIGGSSDVINRISIDKSKTYTLYFDGGSRGNPGIAGAGMVIYDDANREIWSGKQSLGDGKTNNVAEYNGLVTGLECAVRLGIEKLRVRGDSDLVIKQVTGDWQCHKQHLKVLLQRALDERRKFKEFGIAHVKRDNNKRADQLANAAMDERVTNLGFAPAPSLGTPNLSQESDIVDICAKQQPTQTKTCNTFDDQDLDLKLSFLQMPTSPHKEVAAVNSSAAAQVGNVVRCCGTFDDEPLEEELMTFQIPDTVQKEIPDNGWLSGLSFLARFEVERIGLQHNQSLKDAISNIDITNTNDAISAIYNEIKSPDNSAASSSPTYNHFLKHCLANEFKVDEGNSCLFLFHAKFTSKGLELLPPEPADVKTRRIHRRFGSYRFLDLHIHEKWKLPTLKDNMKKIFTDNKVIIAGHSDKNSLSSAWCCWNEELVSSIHECPERNQTSVTVADPWKERVIDFNNADWTNIVITYTMHHRRDKMILGTIVNTLGNIRDDPSISPNEAEILAGKAFVQVDNPHTSQWTDHDSETFRYSSIPHWRGSKNNGNIYTSKRVLGLLFDMLSEASGKKFDYAEIEAEMNIHIRQVIEKAEQKDAAYVNIIREEMLKRLDCFNKTVKAICESKDDSDVQKRVRNKAIKDLYRQHYSEIKNEYKDNAFDAFAILYEQTYLKSRERMRRFKKTPYVFAWNVGPDHLLRIIADGNSGEELSRSMARDNYRVLKRQRNTMIS